MRFLGTMFSVSDALVFQTRYWNVDMKLDGFVESPISALRFISLSLRRTVSTSHDTRFARLELGAFYFAIGNETFYETINLLFKDAKKVDRFRIAQPFKPIESVRACQLVCRVSKRLKPY